MYTHDEGWVVGWTGGMLVLAFILGLLALVSLETGINEPIHLARSMISSLQGNPELLPEREAKLVEQYRDLARMGNPTSVDRERLIAGETIPIELTYSRAYRRSFVPLYVRAAAGEDIAASELPQPLPTNAILLYGGPILWLAVSFPFWFICAFTAACKGYYPWSVIEWDKTWICFCAVATFPGFLFVAMITVFYYVLRAWHEHSVAQAAQQLELAK
ncbi:hypothetical protein CL628_04050 [bacterium]|nr:hypothetical protein [bacterium]